jgi:hypothetical protein
LNKFNKKVVKPKVSFSILPTNIPIPWHRHSFSIAINSQTNYEGLSDSSIKENAVKRAFDWYVILHMSDKGHFRPIFFWYI